MESRMFRAVCAFSIASAFSSSAYAVPYKIIPIVDSSGTLSRFGVPARNNIGTVTYPTRNIGVRGIYKDAGSLVVDSSGAFFSFDFPAINGNGTVAYRAILDGGGNGIYTDGGTVVLDDTGPFSGFGNVAINDSGHIAFLGFLDDGTEGIYLASPVPIPAAAWLFGSGLLGLIGISRRKQTA